MGINIVMEHVKVVLDSYRELVKIHEELVVVISHGIPSKRHLSIASPLGSSISQDGKLKCEVDFD
jgi:hypothetical protein